MTMESTRRALHGVAELVLAGPQYRRSGTIRLQVVPGGFGTVADPELRVVGGHLVCGEVRVPLSENSCSGLARAVGVDVGVAEGVYGDGSGVTPGEALVVDDEVVAALMDAYAKGDAALRALGGTPVLWPEHFDLGVTLDEVNYGVSPGDGYRGVPYAYVGPWKAREGAFWNAPFGAARPLEEGLDLDAFFAEGRRLTA
ncbi:hypothetical protein ACIBG8_41345 [Nonomuraea sp. NPDC050556]|uniref:hypothetical protein n=1 Tax=Nonomuraea sp. NPDC050556 TaxID=3364369 RepID=UPI0037A7CB55